MKQLARKGQKNKKRRKNENKMKSKCHLKNVVTIHGYISWHELNSCFNQNKRQTWSMLLSTTSSHFLGQITLAFIQFINIKKWKCWRIIYNNNYSFDELLPSLFIPNGTKMKTKRVSVLQWKIRRLVKGCIQVQLCNSNDQTRSTWLYFWLSIIVH